MPRRKSHGYEISMSADDAATIRIFGDIGDSWWGDSVTASEFAQALDDLGEVGQINLHINSPGGDAFEGVTIYNTLKDHPAHVTTTVDGLAASAASIVAMAGDEIVMNSGAQMMIHDAAGFAFGFASEMHKMGDILDKLSDSAAGIYAKRAQGSRADFRQAMRDESWYTDEEAVAAGLADRVAEDSTTDAEDAVVARGSRAVSMFRYAGRKAAPDPRIPARMSAAQEDDVTDESMKKLREALGLGDDADEDAIVAAVEAQKDAGGAGEGEGTAPAAKLPDGVRMIDESTLAQLQGDAQKGREARDEQDAQRRTMKVDKALRLGKIPPARRDHWLAQLAADEQGATAVLDALAEGTIPLEQRGYDAGGNDEDNPTLTSLDKVRESDPYKAWRF